MKRKLIASIIVLSMLFGLCSCGEEEVPNDEVSVNEETETEEKSQLNVTENEEATEQDETIEVSEEKTEETIEEIKEETVTVEEESGLPKAEDYVVENPVIFESEGVKVTFTGFKEDFSGINICMENNNPENKRAEFWLEGISLNGIDTKLTERIRISASTGESVVAEESSSLYECFLYDRGLREKLGIKQNADEMLEYNVIWSLIDENVNAMPIQTIGFYYGYKIGSDSPYTSDGTVIKTQYYDTEDFQKVYGELVTTFTTPDTSFEVYSKELECGMLILFRSLEDTYENLNISWMMNDGFVHSYTSCIYSEEGLVSAGKDEISYCLILKKPDEIRKEHEIPNDIPLEISVTISEPGEEGYEGAFTIIPIMTYE